MRLSRSMVVLGAIFTIVVVFGVAFVLFATPGVPESDVPDVPSEASTSEGRGPSMRADAPGGAPRSTVRGGLSTEATPSDPGEPVAPPGPVEPGELPDRHAAAKRDINLATEALLDGDAAAAAHGYEQVLADPDLIVPLRLFTEYKLAWAYLELGREAEAHALMQGVVDTQAKQGSQLEGIVEQARDDYAEWEPLE